MKFGHIKENDIVTRSLGGMPMKMLVGNVDDKYIYVGSADGMIPWKHGWKFRRENGAEVDEDLGWDGTERTGSVLILELETINKNDT